MQRKFFLVAVLAVSAAPLTAQQQAREVAVTAERRKLDSLRTIMDRRTLTVDEVKSLSADLKMQLERYRTAQSDWQRDANSQDRARSEQIAAAMKQDLGDMLTKQRLLVLACSILQPREGDPEGFLGFQVNKDALDMVRTAVGGADAQFARNPEVVYVQPGTPAAKADVREGDVWVAFDGRPVLGALRSELNAKLKSGARMELRLNREGRDVTLNITTAQRPGYPAQDCDVDNLQFMFFNRDGSAAPQVRVFGTLPPNPPMVAAGPLGQSVFAMRVMKTISVQGATFVELTNEQRDAFPKVPPDEGVLVQSVTQGSVAETAGLRSFDVVTRANGQVISSVSDLARLLTSGAQVTMWVVRNETQRAVTLPGR